VKNKVAVVIVTYNRLELLKECLNRINQYAHDVDKILIVNNGSTDQTYNFLEEIRSPKIIPLHQSENLGGAAGFYIGVKYAVEQLDTDFLWIMDDDTFIQEGAMENMINKFSLHPDIGFVNSHVIFKDFTAHVMNIPRFNKKYKSKTGEFNLTDFLIYNALLISTGSFVSLMVRTSTVVEVGYPIKDYFIWVDDSEYTARIAAHGYLGVLATDSVVMHYTKANNGTNIKDDLRENAWRYYYLLRNKFHFYKTVYRKKLPYFLFVEIPGYLYLILRRKDSRLLFMKYWIKGVLKGIFFKPAIDKKANM
jgi:hypothetical protein